MKRLLKKSVIFITVFMLMLYSLNAIYSNTNGYKDVNNMYSFNSVSYNLELVNFGTSHGMMGIDYQNEPYNAFNFGLTNQLLYYDYCLLEQYSDHLNEDCVVIIPVSYLSLYHNYSEQLPKQEPRYYGYLDDKYLNITFEKYIRYVLFPILSSGNGNILYLIKDKANISNPWKYNIKYMGENELIDNAENCVRYHYYSKLQVFRPVDNKSVYYTKKMIEYCKNNGYTPVLITIPTTDEYTNKIPQKVYDEFYSIVPGIAEEYNVTYLDYSNHTEISSNHTLFSDSTHLNVNGRKAFTKLLISDLQNKSLLKLK
ncbi:hypothetical protein J2127_001049 [Methanococcus voltae]|uniref:SGNH/GDSL hydrolase family protein n=1 Tax=Methanococcus voltae TaxID=2188 RepID=UPI001AEB1157|nr:SGNH/GDSL hydrolase family protein [Methanococcus voltae]MBP2143880.1 hypothetical protein [Methanococcus voltae]